MGMILLVLLIAGCKTTVVERGDHADHRDNRPDRQDRQPNPDSRTIRADKE